MVTIEKIKKGARGSDGAAGGRKSDASMAAPSDSAKSSRKIRNIASRFSTGNMPFVKRENSGGRRFTAPNLPTGQLSYYDHSLSQNDFSSAVSDPVPQHEYPRRTTISQFAPQDLSTNPPNLDYLSFNDPIPSPNDMSPGSGLQNETPDLLVQQIRPSLDSLFPSEDFFASYVSSPPSADLSWCSDVWAMPSSLGSRPNASQGCVSFSEEDLTSGEELSSCDLGTESHGLKISDVDGLAVVDGLKGNFGL